MSNTTGYQAITYIEHQQRKQEQATNQGHVITEKAVQLSVNSKAWLTFMCTPTDLESLAAGFLYNENVINSAQEIADIYIHDPKANIDVWLHHTAEEPKNWRRTAGCTGGYTAAILEEITPVKANTTTIKPPKVLALIRELLETQDLYRKAGGVHSAAISDGETILLQADDVGRHNTLDKVIGQYLLQEINCPAPILLTTGRISSEMLQKAARIGAPILISRTSPTSLSIELAEKLGITLIGYARGHRFNTYAHAYRVLFSPG